MLEVTSIDQVDATAVSQIRSELQAFLSEQYPNVTFSRGVFSELVISAHATLYARNQQTLSQYLAARSLLQISRDPSLAADESVDHILSNYLITRNTGSQATGRVTIIVSQRTTVTIAAGLVFESGGQQFTSDSVYSARAVSAQVIATGDRLLRPLEDGNYAFDINVTSTAAGPATLLRQNATLIPVSQPANFVTAFAAEDFVGGLSYESNEALVARLQRGVAAKGASNRVTMKALIDQQSQFAEVTRLSIVGHADKEMTRDQHGFPVSAGNTVDWYVRGREDLLSRTVRLIATHTEINSDGFSVWAAAIPPGTFSGFYKLAAVRSITAANRTGSFPVSTLAYSLTAPTSEYRPDVLSNSEASFTTYEQLSLQFVDTDKPVTNLTVGDVAEYDFDLVGTPNIAELQSFLNKRDNRFFGGDVLVRAAVPCFVEVSILLEIPPGSEQPDEATIAAAVVREINQTDFTGRLYATRIHDVVGSLLPASARFAKATLFGQILSPDRSVIYLQSSDVLVVPEDRHKQVSSKTVQFFATLQDVNIEVTNSIPQPA